MAKVMFEVFSLLLNVDVVEEEGVSSIPAKPTNREIDSQSTLTRSGSQQTTWS